MLIVCSVLRHLIARASACGVSQVLGKGVKCYAMELLQTAMAEIEVKHMELVESLQEEVDLTDARTVLSRFAL